MFSNVIKKINDKFFNNTYFFVFLTLIFVTQFLKKNLTLICVTQFFKTFKTIFGRNFEKLLRNICCIFCNRKFRKKNTLPADVIFELTEIIVQIKYFQIVYLIVGPFLPV